MRWVCLALLVACGSDRRPADRDGGGVDARLGDTGGLSDVRISDTASDSASPLDSGSDSGSPSDSGSDSASPTDTGMGPDGGALDPALSPAAPDGVPCSTPGSMGECPGIQVCRFFDASSSRCESCGPCGNLGNSCSASNQCDILFMCYAGRCTNICPLGTSFCGPPDDCLDVGHPTHGVCRP